MADKTETEEGKEPEKKSKKMLFIILAVVLLGGGGGGAAFFLKGSPEVPTEAGAEPVAQEEPAGLVSLDTFLVNLRGEGGERYMKTTMRLAVAPEGKADKISDDDLKLAQIRDRILTLLMAKSFEELSHPLGKEGLRMEIQAQVDPLLDGGQVRDVLFSEFVVQ